MKKLIVENIKTFKYCGKSFIRQEVFFKLMTAAIGYPFVLLILHLTLKVAKVPYLTNEVAKRYFGNPFTVLCIVLLLLLISVYTMYEISMITVYYDYDVKRGARNDYGVTRLVTVRFLSFFKKKNIAGLLYGILVLPVLSVTGTAMLIFSPSVPKSMININRKESIIIGVVYALMLIIAVFGIFTANIIITEKCGFVKAVKKSVMLVKSHFIKTILYILIWNAIVALVIALIYLIYSVIVIGGVKLLGKNNIGVAVYLTALRGLSSSVFIMILVLYIPLTFLVIITMYTVYMNDDSKEKFLRTVRHAKPKHEKIYFVLSWILTVVTIAVNAYYVKNAVMGNPFSKLGIVKTPKITAHRGSSGYAPENTMTAFEYAVRDMADYIELDVKQTRDGVVIVLHDANLNRTTGVNKDIWTVDYDYVKTLDAGSWFDESFSDVTVPTLEEVLVHCKGKIKLNIEIKPTGYDKNLEQAVVELVEKYDMVGDVVITSMKYDVLKEVKRINPKIKTGYIMSAAYGKFYNMEYADFFSVNYSFVTRKIVDLIHNNGKSIHVWTVNGSADMEEMAKMGVDNIITDNPVKCREIVYSKYSNEKIMDILKYVFE